MASHVHRHTPLNIQHSMYSILIMCTSHCIYFVVKIHFTAVKSTAERFLLATINKSLETVVKLRWLQMIDSVFVGILSEWSSIQASIKYVMHIKFHDQCVKIMYRPVCFFCFDKMSTKPAQIRISVSNACESNYSNSLVLTVEYSQINIIITTPPVVCCWCWKSKRKNSSFQSQTNRRIHVVHISSTND